MEAIELLEKLVQYSLARANELQNTPITRENLRLLEGRRQELEQLNTFLTTLIEDMK